MLTAGLVWSLGSIFYHRIIKLTLQDRIKFKIFALRDELRRMGISQECNPDSFSYQYLEKILNLMVSYCDRYTIGTLLKFKIQKPDLTDPIKITEQFDAEAPLILKKIEDDALQCMIFMAVVNSPCWALSIFYWYALLHVFNWTKKKYDSYSDTGNRFIWSCVDYVQGAPLTHH